MPNNKKKTVETSFVEKRNNLKTSTVASATDSEKHLIHITLLQTLSRTSTDEQHAEISWLQLHCWRFCALRHTGCSAWFFPQTHCTGYSWPVFVPREHSQTALAWCKLCTQSHDRRFLSTLAEPTSRSQGLSSANQKRWNIVAFMWTIFTFVVQHAVTITTGQPFQIR